MSRHQSTSRLRISMDGPVTAHPRVHPLRFGKRGDFTIVQFTDLHWRNGDETDRHTSKLMARVLDTERPDLVVLTGDVIEGGECADPARAWLQAVAAMEERAVPWAAVFGNHDAEGSLGREELIAVQQSCRMCLSEPGPKDVPGVGNYVLALQSARDRSIAAALYFLDSGGLAPAGMDGYAWITAEQIQWYREASRRLNDADASESSNTRRRAGHTRPTRKRGENVRPITDPRSRVGLVSDATTRLGPVAAHGRSERIPALAFFHIPLPEFAQVWDPQTCPGSKHEEVCCPQSNSGFLSALHEQGDVIGVFVGHDHLNDFEATLDGIRLCYGRATGYGGYGRNDFPRGARVIRLREGERTFTTWLRLDSDSAH